MLLGIHDDLQAMGFNPDCAFESFADLCAIKSPLSFQLNPVRPHATWRAELGCTA